MSSWKTTVGGVLAALAALSTLANLPPWLHTVAVIAGAFGAAFGLGAARDNNVTSIDAGAVTKSATRMAEVGAYPAPPKMPTIPPGATMLIGALMLCGCSGAKAPLPPTPVANVVDELCLAEVPAPFQWLCGLSPVMIDALYALVFPGGVGAEKLSATEKRAAIAKKLAAAK